MRFSSSLSSKSAAMRYSLSSIIVWIHSPSNPSQPHSFQPLQMLVATSIEHKTVHAYLLIAMHANFVDEIFFVSQRTERRHKPAIAIPSLAHVAGASTFLVENWIIEYILMTVKSPRSYGPARYSNSYRNTFDRPGSEIPATRHQPIQAVAATALQIPFDVKVWVPILEVHPSAFGGNLLDGSDAFGRCLLVRFSGSLTVHRTLGIFGSFCSGIGVFR